MTKEQILTETIDASCSGMRIDRYLCLCYPEYSRSFYQKLLEEEAVLVNGRPVKASYRTSAADMVVIHLPAPKESVVLPEDIPLQILYEDTDVLVINKPKGMVVHPSAGHEEHTVVNAVLYHCRGELSGINGVLRPGIVHRIDKDTTGAIVICKNDRAHMNLAQQLKEHSITRKYEAIVLNNLKDDTGMIDAPIGRSSADRKKMAVNVKNGRHAVTHYRVCRRFKRYTHIECTLETGRTHQIRVHMAFIGHPILGDPVYGPRDDHFTLHGKKLEGQTLHARVLGFKHPTTGQYMEFEAPLSDYFHELLRIL